MNAPVTPARLAPQLSAIREQFPILAQTVHGKPLVYLDNAATTQKPLAVLDAMRAFELRDYANIHRGVHALSQRATDAFEAAREKVAAFVHARSADEIVFVRGATEAINLVAQSYTRPRLQPGDELLVTAMEHHADIVPWQMVCDATGAKLRVAPIRDDGALDLQALPELLGPRTRMLAVTHVSNVLGTVNDVASVAQLAHARGVPVLVDGAQAVAHLPVDVQALGCDFYVFSGHKLYGPTGIGVLWGRAEMLAAMPPYQGGGDMIRSVSFERTTYADPPTRFEAGTPHITGAVGLAAAIDFVQGLGWDAIAQHERTLLERAQSALSRIPGLRIYGTVPDKIGVISFNIDGLHAHDLGTIADAEGVAIRAGHHCAMPLMKRYGVAAMARSSLGVYNKEDDIDALVRAVRKAQVMFAA
ncbi:MULTISPECIES: aminotransferase class V-fold PLP-dependent enzyme [unclassified Thiomonas]|uniref:aminotransferase class V-fold PLP-dependent enzyme n=1 Tax=unclassified Thiomonas TaxID=2625466 RepID=UPI0004DBB717|nr:MULTISPECIES: cysteine desulfurase [unclassified Thiomonas]CDW94474.1 selenocysteine lyase, PLP-dependent [Thiomonas sp. CB2]VDY04360.1 selenocysteine lyase, PLP-dependent [Thiomonas sp. Bio17B3]VDY08467.1 selenocysteine lyase, PLP-dependent [Thiomonas sp. Sup16B3]VDY12605.1 Cysteine desulfurase (Selenocysteine lyase) (Selenocysteine reductase) (Selenocysteine beta-lyase) (SCL) [Thiomonas sp. OC7]VDY18183.1 selenocysteine lyase, PLP-dependent [Thiomonas sp. CB2]